jgi:hypothetical protein
MHPLASNNNNSKKNRESLLKLASKRLFVSTSESNCCTYLEALTKRFGLVNLSLILLLPILGSFLQFELMKFPANVQVIMTPNIHNH